MQIVANNREHYQMSFLPWAGLKEEIKIGPIIFWPFHSRGGKNRIKDHQILKYLTQYFRCYIDHEGRSVNTITICSYGNINFQTLTTEEYSDLRTVEWRCGRKASFFGIRAHPQRCLGLLKTGLQSSERVIRDKVDEKVFQVLLNQRSKKGRDNFKC